MMHAIVVALELALEVFRGTREEREQYRRAVQRAKLAASEARVRAELGL